VIYFTRAEGPFKATQTLSIDAPILTDMYAHFTTQYTAFNSVVTDYNNKKDTYNNAIESEKSRLSDFFRTYFEAGISIPQRPCPPT